jgi:hypothetical protein
LNRTPPLSTPNDRVARFIPTKEEHFTDPFSAHPYWRRIAAGARKTVNKSHFASEKYVQSLRDLVEFSCLYGERYDWTPPWSMRSGQIVGALPVGIETRGMNDALYWPTQICWTHKEV